MILLDYRVICAMVLVFFGVAIIFSAVSPNPEEVRCKSGGFRAYSIGRGQLLCVDEATGVLHAVPGK